MKLVVNGEHREFADLARLSDIVAELTDAAQGIAVAVNATVVPRGSWTTTGLADGDEIEVLTAVQGG
ncbi:MAG: sulfur carrier protein ThiS [Acidothermaceae bacterium]